SCTSYASQIPSPTTPYSSPSFFFQAEDGIRDFHVTGVQTCALPITLRPTRPILSGIVTDESGEPLIGVNVLIKGTTRGTSTDFEGRFTLDEVDEQAVLVVSYIGYQTQEIKVGGRTMIEIVLIEDSQTLDEVVVVGYGTQKKSDLTG